MIVYMSMISVIILISTKDLFLPFMLGPYTIVSVTHYFETSCISATNTITTIMV